ncbi:aminotransferase class I/II-fold pyridoxal phosphate-dependent enzyme [Sphingomonas glaciei]|uniref:Aminotransferase class I/II-fold pyridoxal phosphate-dependent enzyme n=1 Tax=Sphingomonas glaciei TaxID=2938948 RepID=A0ABY5MXX2_9SPHN|nr:aminotransferase class I/II-fold pyridoxal phosphate-dependent enzyme [Sphingomonas glaciei]UUR08610.1 aminotransferase class I/II-fold pyridoxal phosphate-dependent enzyme [Sphingomonas glaciei]
MNPQFETMKVSIFEEMSLAAARHGAVNLGQGFPDFGWPEPLLEDAARLVRKGSNQYPPSRGLPVLREALAAFYAERQGLAFKPEQFVVTSGATEAIAAVLLAALEPGDGAIVIAPAYDAYAPLIRRSGGQVQEVVLRPPSWRIDRALLETAATPSTRLLVVNNPHNPTGRLLDGQELGTLVDFAREHDLLILSDEVWEEVLAPGVRFTSLASLAPERTVKVGSAGKIFSLTGWKVGWAAATAGLADIIARAHQYLTFATPPHLQAAVAAGLGHPEWLDPPRHGFARARQRLADGLQEAGYVLLPSEGTYFQCVDLPASGISLDDRHFATMAVEQAGVAVIPLSPFTEGEPERGLIRLCFAKSDATIDAGIAAMAMARALAGPVRP